MPQPHGVLAHRFGTPHEVLHLESISPPTLDPGIATVRMIASPINPSDLIPVTGAYQSRTKLPFIPGFEGVGTVETIHPGIDSKLLNQRVLPIGSAGGWQSLKPTPLEWCIPVPDDISDRQAATAYINPLTAIRMVDAHAGAPSVHTAVVNAAGSAIARTLCHLLNRRGIRVIGLQRTPCYEDIDVGWSHLIDTSVAGWSEELRSFSVDLAFDCVGGEEGTVLAQSLRTQGIFVHYGLLSGQPLSPSLSQQRPDLTIDFFRLRDWVHHAQRPELLDAFAQAFTLIRDRVVRTRIQTELPLHRFPAGIELSLTRASQGKVLLLS